MVIWLIEFWLKSECFEEFCENFLKEFLKLKIALTYQALLHYGLRARKFNSDEALSSALHMYVDYYFEFFKNV